MWYIELGVSEGGERMDRVGGWGGVGGCWLRGGVEEEAVRRWALPAITGARCSWESGAIHHVRDGGVMWREVMAFLSSLKQKGGGVGGGGIIRGHRGAPHCPFTPTLPAFPWRTWDAQMLIVFVCLFAALLRRGGGVWLLFWAFLPGMDRRWHSGLQLIFLQRNVSPALKSNQRARPGPTTAAELILRSDLSRH